MSSANENGRDKPAAGSSASGPADGTVYGVEGSGSLRPALMLAPKIAELGILGVVAVVGHDRSGYRLAMPEWSHLVVEDHRDADGTAVVGFNVKVGLRGPEHLEATMHALNGACELRRLLAEVTDAMDGVIGSAVAALEMLGVSVRPWDAPDDDTDPTPDPEAAV